MAWRQSGDKPLSEPMMVTFYVSLGLNELITIKLVYVWVNQLIIISPASALSYGWFQASAWKMLIDCW